MRIVYPRLPSFRELIGDNWKIRATLVARFECPLVIHGSVSDDEPEIKEGTGYILEHEGSFYYYWNAPVKMYPRDAQPRSSAWRHWQELPLNVEFTVEKVKFTHKKYEWTQFFPEGCDR